METTSSEINSGGSVRMLDVDRSIIQLAVRISHIHGDVLITKEAGGVHLNFASPRRLKLDGDIELHKKHMTINAEKYLGLGKFRAQRGRYNPERSAYCMKSGKSYAPSVQELLTMPNLDARGITATLSGVGVSMSKKAKLVDDGRGNMIPDHPGEVIPVTELPEGHPCIEYIRSRGYDPQALYDQFRCSYCIEEAPEGEEYGRFYRRLPNFWKDTPQGRLIFYCDIHGIQKGWQARILERIHRGEKQHYHPYNQQWETTHTWETNSEGVGSWKLVEELQDEAIPHTTRVRSWTPSKYRTAPGAERNSMLMGYDAAVRWNKEKGYGDGERRCMLVEGPLDAGRFGAPSIAYLGKYFSANQGRLVTLYFSLVAAIRDGDAAGEQTEEYMRKNLHPAKPLLDFPLPQTPGSVKKDPGDFPPAQAAIIKQACLNRLAQ